MENLFNDRIRTNILKKYEQFFIYKIVLNTPKYITPNIFTFIGIIGSIIVMLSFIYSKYILFGILGLLVNWIGDSLDGRIAYYRNIQRKWYGFSLDIIIDWFGIVLIGIGIFSYLDNDFKILSIILLSLYGWTIIIALIHYKITNKYKIDNGYFGPTEMRVIISLFIFI